MRAEKVVRASLPASCTGKSRMSGRHLIRAAAERPPLVMRFGAFGDMVLLTVLLRQLHARFGKPVDVISSGPWTKPLLEGQPSLGRLFVIRSRRTPYWLSLDQRRLVAWLRERGAGPDLVLRFRERTAAPRRHSG